MKNLRMQSTALLALLALAACSDNPVQPTIATNTGALGHANGLVEVTISGIGSDQMSSAARYIPGPDAGTPSKAAPSGISRAPMSGGRLSTTNLASGVEISALSTSSFTYGERGNGGYRYVSATYKVRNAPAAGGTGYTTSPQNVTFVAVNGTCPSTAATLSGTAVCNLLKFDGSAADAGMALQVLPTGGAVVEPSSGNLTSYPADVLQVFEEGDVGDVSLPSGGVSILPYGFVVRTSSSTNRDLPASPGTGVYDGLVTFAFRVPLQAGKSDDPFTISALFLPVEDNQVVVTQSLEEADASSIDLINSRASALTGASVLSLTGHVFNVTTNGICSVRTAGTDVSPTAYLVQGLANEVTPTPFSAAASFIASNSVFSLSACQLLHPATSTNFAVNGSQSGRLTLGYGGSDSYTISTPARSGGYFPGEEVQVSLTAGILDANNTPLADPRVLQYRVATTAGTGALALDNNYAVGMNPHGLALADLNGDGNLDMVSSNESDSTVTVRLGSGSGAFGDSTSFLTGGDATEDLRIVDVNNDGILDIVTATRASVQGISVVLGNGDGTFGSYNMIGIPGMFFGASHMTVGDYNNDGNVDAIVNAFTGQAYVMLGNGSGGFTYNSSFASNAQYMVTGDVNNDGKLDIVGPYSTTLFLVDLGNGDGTFTAANQVAADAQNYVALADMNGDGNLDIVYAAASSNGVSVALGDGAGHFSETGGSPYATTGVSALISVGDVNADGKLDVVSVDAGSPNSNVEVLLGDGNGGLGASSGAIGDNGDSSSGVVLGDVNSDGALDAVVVNAISEDVAVLLGTP